MQIGYHDCVNTPFSPSAGTGLPSVLLRTFTIGPSLCEFTLHLHPAALDTRTRCAHRRRSQETQTPPSCQALPEGRDRSRARAGERATHAAGVEREQTGVVRVEPDLHERVR